MKKLFSILAAITALWMATPASKAEVRVSVDFFHDNLAPYGDWVEVGNYGYCWHPRDVDREWRPYSNGRWVYTDAGWTFDSDEPFGWAVYHYGRWTRVEEVGWVWVPGTEWGPAWVSWRHGSNYIGWAPLPPEAEFRASIGLNAQVDAEFDIGPTFYNFVEVRSFGAPRLREVIVQPRENLTIIQQTTNITKITTVNNVVYNEGPQYEVVSRQSTQPIPRLKLERQTEFKGDPSTISRDQLKTEVKGDSLHVVALPFDNKPATAPKKIGAKIENAKVDRGWANAGPASEVDKVRTQLKSKSTATPANAPGSSAEKVAPAKPEATPGKLPKGKKSAKPEAPNRQVTPGETEQSTPATPRKPDKKKEGETPRQPEGVSQPEGGTRPDMQVNKPEKKHKRENVEPMDNMKPTTGEIPKRPGKGEKQPKPERITKPESHEAPAGLGQPEPQKQKGVSKGKSKDAKKEAPEAPPQ